MKLFGEDVPYNSVTELLRAKAEVLGDETALVIDGSPLSYRTWDERSDHLAGNLLRAGVGRGDRVATMLYNCAEQLLLWYAAAKIGALWTPINVALSGEDLARTLATADPALLIVEADTAAAAALARDRIPTYFVGRAEDAPQYTLPFENLSQARERPSHVEAAPSDPAVLMFSGGTTGLPKAAIIPHFAYIAGAVRYRQFWRPQSDDVHFTTLQLFHTGCQHGATVAPLAAGVTGVLERKFSAREYWRRVCETNATLIDPLGTMLPFLCRQPPSEYDRGHRVRACWFATAHLPPSQRQEFEERFGVRLAPGSYGSTECGGNYVVSGRFGDDAQPPDAIGKSWGWVDIRIADDDDNALPAGAIGNVLLRPTVSNTFMLSYFRDPDRTAPATRNLWLHTGDLGRLDGNGYFYFEGRQLHWLRRRGENISALEIEGVLSQHPGISECAVVGVPAELGGEEEIKAFVILRDGEQLTPEDLHAWCCNRLSRFKAPRYIAFVSDFPRSAAKREIERAKLKAMPNSDAWDADANVRPDRR